MFYLNICIYKQLAYIHRIYIQMFFHFEIYSNSLTI